MQNYYSNKFGGVELPFSDKVVGLSMSGGADSTMLCYLLAKFVPDIIIQPINGFDLGVPGDSNKLPKIIEYIRNDFKDVEIRWPLSTVFSNDDFQPIKHDYIRTLKSTALEYKMCDTIISAITKGPPLEDQIKFITYDGENTKRIEGYALYDEVLDGGPFNQVDKRFIIQCYKDFDKEDLLEMTASCVAPNQCGYKKCWWCCERQWAIREVNNV